MRNSFFPIALCTALLTACQPYSGNTDSHADLDDTRTNAPTAEAPKTNPFSRAENYSKPGAPIEMRHSLKNPVAINQASEFEVLMIAQTAGELTVTISSEDELIPNGNITLTQSVSLGEITHIPVSVLALEEGKYYLNVQASLNTTRSAQNRAFAIAVITSGHAQTAAQSVKPAASGEPRIKSSAAQESFTRDTNSTY